jgi:hypothetical protein
MEHFMFLAPDLLLTASMHDGPLGRWEFETVRLASGEVVSTQSTAIGTKWLGVLRSASNPNFVIVSRGIGLPVIGMEKLNYSALEFSTGKAILIHEDSRLVDVWGSRFAEVREGELWLWERGPEADGLTANEWRRVASIVLRRKLSDELKQH